MQVLSSVTQKEWLRTKEAVDGKADPAEQEARRVLSDLFRCNNLVVLSGLGTSLCVKNPATGGKLAPTMWDLWTSVKAKYLEQTGMPWDDILALVRHTPDDSNLETLLSRCRLAEDFLDGDELERLKRFISIAETDIKGKVDFIKAEHHLCVTGRRVRRNTGHRVARCTRSPARGATSFSAVGSERPMATSRYGLQPDCRAPCRPLPASRPATNREPELPLRLGYPTIAWTRLQSAIRFGHQLA